MSLKTSLLKLLLGYQIIFGLARTIIEDKRYPLCIFCTVISWYSTNFYCDVHCCGLSDWPLLLFFNNISEQQLVCRLNIVSNITHICISIFNACAWYIWLWSSSSIRQFSVVVKPGALLVVLVIDNPQRSLTYLSLNILRPRQNGRLFPDDIFRRIFLNEKIWISINISLKFTPKGFGLSSVQTMDLCPVGAKPLSGPIQMYGHPGTKCKFEHTTFA